MTKKGIKEVKYEGEDYPFERIFKNATARTLDWLILRQNIPQTKEVLCKVTCIPRRTMDRLLPYLVKEGIVKRERISYSFAYELNLESERTRALIGVMRATIRENLNDPDFYKR